MKLYGKTALITGATRGIGNAIAHEFLHAGSRVILTGTNKTKIGKLDAENENEKIKWIFGDFSTVRGIELFINDLDKIKNIDICINNAGINNIKLFDKYIYNDYQRLMAINLTAPFFILQKLLPGMKKKKWGRIVNVASIWSQISKPGRALYSTAKTGLVGLTRSIAIEYASSNIIANTVSPGFTLTELTKQSLSRDEMEKLSNQIPMGRFANPDEISKMILFLCSNMNTYMTGQNIVIDGGFSHV